MQSKTIVLGEVDGRIITSSKSTLCFGPEAAVLDDSFIIPALLEWEGPIIWIGGRKSVAEHTFKWREQLGPVSFYDPFSVMDSIGLNNYVWSPKSTSATLMGGIETAELCLDHLMQADSIEELSWLSRLLGLAFYVGHEMNWPDHTIASKLDANCSILEEAMKTLQLDEMAWIQLFTVQQRSQRQRSLGCAMLQRSLRILSCQAPGEILDIEQTLMQNGTLYICDDPGWDTVCMAPASSVIINEAISKRRPLSSPLLLIHDGVFPIANLAQISKQTNLLCLGAYTNSNNIGGAWGGRAKEIFDAVDCKAYLAGSAADVEILKGLGKAIADDKVERVLNDRSQMVLVKEGEKHHFCRKRDWRQSEVLSDRVYTGGATND